MNPSAAQFEERGNSRPMSDEAAQPASQPTSVRNPTGAPPRRRVPHRLTVVYDENCELCRRARDWLALQPSYVELELIAAGSDEAQRRYGSLPWLGEELVIVDEAGHVWIGPAAFLVAIWSTRDYRPWSYRLSGPTFAPLAERFFHLISTKRKRLGAMLNSPECTYCARPGVRS